MKIAIDINDVVRDYTNQFIKCYQKIIDPSFEISENDFNFITSKMICGEMTLQNSK